MREDLLGYLLGALDDEEMARISAALIEDPGLRQMLEELAINLRPLDEAHDLYEPPAGLIERTVGAIAAVEMEPPVLPAASAAAGVRVEGGSARVDASDQVRSIFRLPAWSWSDAIVSTCAAVLLACVVIPGILRQRALSRLELCQNQLRELGIALTSYAIRGADSRFPHLEVRGPESFAGVYAVRLMDQGLLAGPRPRWCPSQRPAMELAEVSIPNLQRLHVATPAELDLIQRAAGGDYAYSLGVHDQESYRAPKFEGRSHFAILSDAPVRTLDGWTMAHEGRGCNVLFEDGHVAFISNWDAEWMGDHLFLNRNGDLAAGLDRNDATLGSSTVPPMLPASYRR